MIDFSNARNIVTAKGEAVSIARGAEILWRRKYKCEVEYLESTGTQWIDTGFVPSSSTRFVVDCELVPDTSRFQCLFGARSSNSNYYVMHHTNGFFYAYYGAGSARHSGLNFLERRTYDLDKNAFIVNGKEAQALEADFEGAYSAFLFGTNKYSNYYPAKMKLYSSQVYGNGVLARDFIPVLDWNDRPCMYDKVTDELFYNAGTGEFLYGSEVAA